VREIRIGSALLAVGAIVALALAVSASAGSSRSAQTPVRIAVRMSEFKFVLKPKIATKRAVVFAVKNNGTVGHDFKVGGKKTPIVGAGKGATLRVAFKKAGRFPFLCTVPGHAAAGMKGVLIVR
jgi:uncharacterized cupredoxin-like copper-binding protein